MPVTPRAFEDSAFSPQPATELEYFVICETLVTQKPLSSLMENSVRPNAVEILVHKA